MLLHLFEMQDRNNSSISESSPWTPSCYSTASKKHSIMTIAWKFFLFLVKIYQTNLQMVYSVTVHIFYQGILSFQNVTWF
jgi:hypothetical protein